MIKSNFWKSKRVFVTGHTGFKGSWLCLMLHMLGANVTGFALNPPTNPSLFELARVDEIVNSIIGDITDYQKLETAMLANEPEVVIHMAAQPLVLESYKNPVLTYATNVMGTVHCLEAVRKCSSVKAIINITTDKCYENKEWVWGYRENDPVGGHDPYSNSKACAELVTSSYRDSFFSLKQPKVPVVGLASVRAGNVIGGGDWADNRLVPDCVQAFLQGENIKIRNPVAVRPWQHVLEPLNGYLLLAQKLYNDPAAYSGGWNFGPEDSDARPVEWIVRYLCAKWEGLVECEMDSISYPHEANYLKLDCSKAKTMLGWYPVWNLEKALDKVIDWAIAFKEKRNIREICLQQIDNYMNDYRRGTR